MFKDYLVIDNVLNQNNIEKLLFLFKNIEYYSNESNSCGIRVIDDNEKPQSNWRGFRSKLLHTIDNELFHNIFNSLITNVFEISSTSKVNYNISSHLHLLPGILKYKDEFWHRDSNHLFSGVIYLNQYPTTSAGTLLSINNQIIDIENKFNRLVLYKSNVIHSPAGWHGDSINDMRLTLTFFVNNLEFTNQ